MNTIMYIEVMEAITMVKVIAPFLLNTGRAIKAIKLCKESCVLLSNQAPSIKQQFRKLFYRGIYETMFNAFCRIEDYINAIKYGRKLLVIHSECGETVQEGLLTVTLAEIYQIQNNYVEAKELYKRAVGITRETGDKEKEAIAYGNLGTVSLCLGEYVKAKGYLEKALAINMDIGDREGAAANYGNMGLVISFLGNHVKAKEFLEKALAINIEISNRAGESLNYENLGRVFKSLYDYVKAKEYFEKALAIDMENGSRARVALNYENLGIVFEYLGDYVKAKEYFEKALAIEIEIGNREREARNYGNLGGVFTCLCDYVKAREYHKKALAINMEIGDKSGQASNYGNLGIVFKALGDYVKAKEYFEKALAMKIEIGDRRGVALSYGNMGLVFRSLGDYVKAKEYHEKALAIEIDIGDREGEAANYGNLGGVFTCLGDYVKAKEYHKKALAINMEIGDKSGEASNYVSLGTVLKSLRDNVKAKEYFEKALAIIVAIGNRREEAIIYQGLGGVLYFIGDNISAKRYFEKALVINLEIGHRVGEVASYTELGKVFVSLGEYVIAEEYFEKALSISKGLGHTEPECKCYAFIASIKILQGKFHDAFSYLLGSIQKYEELQGFNAVSDEIKIYIADKLVFLYKMLCGMLCDSGDHNISLYVAELGRARALADLMETQYSGKKYISGDPQSWIGIENIITKESNCTCLYISYYQQRVFLWILKTSGETSFREITVSEKTLYKTLAKPAENLDEFFAIMAKSFRYFGILPKEVCEDRSFSETEEAQSDSYQEESLTALKRGKDKKHPDPSLTLLHKMLIDPVADLLDEPEIIIVPDRNLYRVPFAALLDESGIYLSQSFRIRIVPSLTTLKLVQDSPADYHSETGALIVGDPGVGDVIYKGRLKNFVPLPGARKEAEMIGRLLGVHPLLGQHATKQVVLQRIASASLIHFAAHGNAERGEIAFAPPGSTTGIPQEGSYLLKMSEISKVQLRAKLVVLSCCHSGRGQIRAEGVVGIARAFLGSGARSVLVALWALEDNATEKLMNCFYEHLFRGESSSESLHEAMKWMREHGYTKVSEWAPFMLIGDNVTFDIAKLKVSLK